MLVRVPSWLLINVKRLCKVRGRPELVAVSLTSSLNNRGKAVFVLLHRSGMCMVLKLVLPSYRMGLHGRS